MDKRNPPRPGPHAPEHARPPAAWVRWRIPFAGFLLGLMGGFSYAWGVLVVPKMERFGWTKAEATLPFTVYMVVLALVMVPAGRLQDRFGPRIVAAAGAVLFFVAYALAALVGYFPHAGWLVFSYGLIGGTACGLTYACIVPPTRKWFPDQPGFAVSTAVMGFGLAALVLAPVKSEYLLPVHGIEGTFLVIGTLTLVVCLGAARILENPPEGWRPYGWQPPVTTGGAAQAKREYTSGELWGTAKFWMTWFTLGSVVAGGLMSIGLIPAFGLSVGLSSAEAAVAISIFAAFNGFGRPVAGLLADRFGLMRVMIATYCLQTAVLLVFPVFAVTLPALYLASALLGWGFAVTLCLFPVLTATCFGVKHLGGNYGLIFTAFGLGAFAPFLGSWMFGLTGSYAPAFIAAGVLAGLGVILCAVMKKQYNLA
ncbi:MAG: OFA family MFS transporter [Pseudomonadota bacterium]